ncbi:MAG TPA: hypothetical protein VFM03_04640 [Candidatus Limnocylindria bacterium]|nr:hypothetical protein [Candidatus Limnocylindria bacterium]
MTAPEPGRVLRLALLAWGLGHLAVGRRTVGRALLVAELVGLLLVAWLTAGLADSSAYLLPFLAGIAFLAAWAGQAIDAYRAAHALRAARAPTPARSPAIAIGWLSLPLLAWATGFWLIGARDANPSAVLDRFVTAWSSDALDGPGWPATVRTAARRAERDLGTDADRFRDVRIRIVEQQSRRATAVAEAIHFERRDTRLLGLFPGTELVPVADDVVLELELRAVPVELVGGGDIGAVRWELTDAHAP